MALTTGQQKFAQAFLGAIDMDHWVLAAWLLAEESGSAAENRERAGNNDWLNIGYTDSATYGSGNRVWADPTPAGHYTAEWIKGNWDDPGFGRSSAGIRALADLPHHDAKTQIEMIQRSGWASSGYPDLPALYHQIGGPDPIGALGVSGGTNAGGSSGAPSGGSVGIPAATSEDYSGKVHHTGQNAGAVGTSFAGHKAAMVALIRRSKL